MIMKLLIIGMEAILSAIPAFILSIAGLPVILAVVAWVVIWAAMYKAGEWYVNREESVPDERILVVKGLLKKLIEPNGTITIYAHPKWAGDLQEIEDFLYEDLSETNYYRYNPKELKMNFSGDVIVFSNARR